MPPIGWIVLIVVVVVVAVVGGLLLRRHRHAAEQERDNLSRDRQIRRFPRLLGSALADDLIAIDRIAAENGYAAVYPDESNPLTAVELARDLGRDADLAQVLQLSVTHQQILDNRIEVEKLLLRWPAHEPASPGEILIAIDLERAMYELLSELNDGARDVLVQHSSYVFDGAEARTFALYERLLAQWVAVMRRDGSTCDMILGVIRESRLPDGLRPWGLPPQLYLPDDWEDLVAEFVVAATTDTFDYDYQPSAMDLAVRVMQALYIAPRPDIDLTLKRTFIRLTYAIVVTGAASTWGLADSAKRELATLATVVFAPRPITNQTLRDYLA